MKDSTRGVTTLRATRLAAGWRREEVAAAAGVGLEAIGRLERSEGVSELSVGRLLRIAGAVGLSASELVPALGMRPREAGAEAVARVKRGS